MQIIDELETTRRGVYCGSIGWIGLDGSMSMNIAIRTMVQIGDEVHVHAGGAIVADSTPEQEYNEILAKAAGMLQALGCEAPARSSRLHEVTIP
jgi:para-aminobenzoate synthetase component 1